MRALSGPVARSLLLESNDPRCPSIALDLIGLVTPFFKVNPHDLLLDLSGGPQTATTEIYPLVNLRAPLSAIVCTNNAITAQLSQPASNRFVLTIQALETLPRGDRVFNVILRSADAADPTCLVKGTIHNPPDLEITPQRLRFEAQDEPQMRVLWIRQHGKTPLRLLDAVPSSDTLHCEIDPDPASYDYRVYVTACNQESAAGRQAVVRLRMDDGKEKERFFQVPVWIGQGEAVVR